MKFSKLSLLAVAGAFAFGAFADAGNILISFSSAGPDVYADGKTVVADGEWYALVWSADGTFEGIGIDGKAVDPNDSVVMMAPLAKNGRCPYTIFQVDSKSVNFKADGTYAIYLLDTRGVDGKASVRDEKSGLPKMLNGAVAAANYAGQVARAGGATREIAAGAVWGASNVPDDVPPPKIVSFDPQGATVKIVVTDMVPGVKYNVVMGKELGKLDTFALQIPQTSDNSTFNIDAQDANLFQVTRQPLDK